MPKPDWVNDDNAALLTDLYQLTMVQAYYFEGLHDTAVFDLFFRRLRKRNYLVACGLDTILHYLESVRFTTESLGFLAGVGVFKPAFLKWLGGFRFTGDVYAIAEGTPVFCDEPIVEVVAPIPEAQLVETFLLNQITFQTGVASKASRVVQAAQGRTVADFGLRRMHGADAGLKAARACYVAGVDATSDVLAAQFYGIRPTGTMAHSYVEVHDSEEEAFADFARLYPGTALLVDTYDTLRAVHRVVELRQQMGDAFCVGAIRLDSGDMAALAKEARRILDEGGLSNVHIFASGSLDEYGIAELLREGAPIDGFGVGTKLGTIADRPYLDSAYKLVEYAGEGRMKLAQHKVNVPGRKQVYRFFEEGKAVRDVVTAHDEASDGRPLLELVMQGGRRTEAGRRTLDEARERCLGSILHLPDELLALEEVAEPYPVLVSARLRQEAQELRRRLEERAGG
ncbi:MAG TPA: nicotinate phosphoribosyltransferase [Rhodothermales bacterium]|nr:nicotinate phosphoribosyltransferase [Rhodothermales bacterium]